ncbi:MAG TPA: ABC transporter permease [Rhizobiaceae bacterium]|nr:ABC transporter permease [Rhizobiaceae bacterium]
MTQVAATGRPAPSLLSRVVKTTTRDPILLCAVLFLLGVAVSVVFAEWIAPHNPLRTSLRHQAKLPSAQFWLGTDEQGRDILSRIIFGLRITLMTSLSGLVIGIGLGSIIGLVAAYFRRLDMLLMRIIDVILSFPAILIGLGLAGVTGGGNAGIIIALAVATVGPAARIARSAALTVVQMDYIAGARMVGLSDTQILLRYVLLNCLASIIVYATLRFGQLILLAASLSFLGLGVAPPAPELGVMVSQGRALLLTAPHVALMPCAVILLLVLSLNLVGDALRDALDPQMKA